MRESREVTIMDGDAKKTFVITPMNAVKAERWLSRALLAVGGKFLNSFDRSDVGTWMSAIDSIEYEKVAPLWDGLLEEGVQIKMADGGLLNVSLDTLAGKVDYPTTIMALKAEVLKTNFGFFSDAGLLKSLTTQLGARNS
mgnify:FL=1